ncbi:MAG: hypothetical protein ACRCU1_03475 [Alsobacter sp.]
MVDSFVTNAKDAANQAFIEYCADDAVPYHMRERLLEPVEGETIAAQRVRAQGAWDFWTGVATTPGLQDTIRLYTGLSALDVWPFNGDNVKASWVTGYVSGINDDNNTDNWSRHAITIAQPHPWDVPVVGPGLVVGPDLMVGLTMTLTELKQIRRAWRRHRPAHMVGLIIYVILDGSPGEDLQTDHSAAPVVKLPLHMTAVGYPATGATVGAGLRVGHAHS